MSEEDWKSFEFAVRGIIGVLIVTVTILVIALIHGIRWALS